MIESVSHRAHKQVLCRQPCLQVENRIAYCVHYGVDGQYRNVHSINVRPDSARLAVRLDKALQQTEPDLPSSPRSRSLCHAIRSEG